MNVFRRGLASMATVKKPSKIICIGRNYATVIWDHVKELNNVRPKQPFFFLKPPTSLLQPGAGPVIAPKGVNLHYEIELALIMGKEVKDLDASDEKGAFDAIESYALAIDMTARNIQEEAKQKRIPWDISKGFDTFLPISQVVPKEKIPDPHNVEIWLKVNGETRQEDSTNLFLFQIPRVISDISKVMTIEAGDIIITGTPKGVGPVGPGDVMTGGIRVDGKEIEEAKLEVPVAESKGAYVFQET